MGKKIAISGKVYPYSCPMRLILKIIPEVRADIFPALWVSDVSADPGFTGPGAWKQCPFNAVMEAGTFLAFLHVRDTDKLTAQAKRFWMSSTKKAMDITFARSGQTKYF